MSGHGLWILHVSRGKYLEMICRKWHKRVLSLGIKSYYESKFFQYLFANDFKVQFFIRARTFFSSLCFIMLLNCRLFFSFCKNNILSHQRWWE